MDTNGRKADVIPKTKASNGNLKTKNKSWPMWYYLIVLAPALIFFIDVSCSKGNCSVTELPQFPKHLSAYLNVEATLMYLAWMALQILLFVMPIGAKAERKTADGGKSYYRKNGFHAFVIMATSVVCLIRLGYTSYIAKIMDNFLALHLMSVLVATLISKHLNSRSMQQYITGSESNPNIWGWDLKRFLLRYTLLTWAIIGFGHQVVAYTRLQQHSPFMIVTVFHFVSVAEGLWFEESWDNSSLLQLDKVGAAFVYTCVVAIPVLATTSVRYLSTIDYHLSEAALIIRFLIAVPGYCFYRGAWSDKVNFEKNPSNQDFDDFYVIQEENGQSILADSYWAHCRNPTYLGAIILTCTTTSFGWVNVYMHICLLAGTGLLCWRSLQMDNINCHHYGARLWAAYKQKVPYRIFKFIY